jgi:hypothetical protein
MLMRGCRQVNWGRFVRLRGCNSSSKEAASKLGGRPGAQPRQRLPAADDYLLNVLAEEVPVLDMKQPCESQPI